MTETARLLGGVGLLLGGTLLLSWVVLLDLGHVQAARWFERTLPMAAAATACIVFGGVLVAG